MKRTYKTETRRTAEWVISKLRQYKEDHIEEAFGCPGCTMLDLLGFNARSDGDLDTARLCERWFDKVTSEEGY